MSDRRREARCAAVEMQVSRATLRPGRHVQVIDVSPVGAQVESDGPLRPGGRVHVRLTIERQIVDLAASIVRCFVWAVHPEQGVTYRAGLRFDERCTRLTRADPSTPGKVAARFRAVEGVR